MFFLTSRRRGTARPAGLPGGRRLAVVYGRRRSADPLFAWSGPSATGGPYRGRRFGRESQRRFSAQTCAERLPGLWRRRLSRLAGAPTRLARDARAASWRGPWCSTVPATLVTASPELPAPAARLDHEAEEARLVVAPGPVSKPAHDRGSSPGTPPPYGRAGDPRSSARCDPVSF